MFNKTIVQTLKDLINDTITASKQPIDEVQLLGGGSAYRFMQSIIADAVNESFRMNATRYSSEKTKSYLKMQNQKKLIGPERKIFPLDVSKDSSFDKDLENTILNTSKSDIEVVNTDLDEFDAVLIGSMFSTLYDFNNKQVSNNPITIKKEKPSHSYYLTIGDNRVIYCEKNSWCQPNPSFQSLTGDKSYTVSIESLEQDTPKGVSLVANRYRLTDLEDFISKNSGDKNEFTAYFTMKSPEPFISSAKLCKGEDNCANIKLKMENGDDLTNEILRSENYEIVNTFYSKLTESKTRELFNTNMERAFNRMKMMCSNNEKSACNEFKVMQQRHANGEFEMISINQLEEEIIPKISSLCKSLGFRYG